MSPRVAMSENPHPPTPAAWVPPSPAMRERACAPGDGATTMKIGVFWLIAAAVGVAVVVLTRLYFTNEYFFFASYVVLQYIVLSTAWNILGGYTGYINFGTGAFFAMGAYTSVVLHKLPALTATWLGVKIPGVPLPLVATTLSGALMGMAGAPLPYYVTYVDPVSSFNLSYAVNSVAMPVIGGMLSWIGPVIGAILLATLQQLATVTISSALNLLIVGLLLIGFVVIAPNGLMGLVSARQRRRAALLEAAALAHQEPARPRRRLA